IGSHMATHFILGHEDQRRRRGHTLLLSWGGRSRGRGGGSFSRTARPEEVENQGVPTLPWRGAIAASAEASSGSPLKICSTPGSSGVRLLALFRMTATT